MTTFEEWEKRILADPAVAKAVAEMEARYRVTRRLLRIRRHRGWSCGAMAAHLGCRPRQYWRLENTEGAPRMKPDAWLRLCALLVEEANDAVSGQ